MKLHQLYFELSKYMEQGLENREVVVNSANGNPGADDISYVTYENWPEQIFISIDD